LRKNAWLSKLLAIGIIKAGVNNLQLQKDIIPSMELMISERACGLDVAFLGLLDANVVGE